MKAKAWDLWLDCLSETEIGAVVGRPAADCFWLGYREAERSDFR